MQGLEPNTFYLFEVAGVGPDKNGDLVVGPFISIVGRTIGDGVKQEIGEPYPDGSGFASQV